jgi:hypothetical protein
MLPEQVINIVQIGLKYLFDIDPFLSEHLVRTAAVHITSTLGQLSSAIRSFEMKISEGIAPLISDIRNLRLSLTEG